MLASLAACGGDDSSDGSSDGSDSSDGSSASGESWILGTTESITAMDPAGSYDFGSWNMQYAIFQRLMSMPAGESEPVGDAAQSCDYDDPQTITCTLNEGLTFSNGNVSSGLLGQLIEPDSDPQVMREDAIETPDDLTVVFHLNAADTTFLKL